MIDQGCWLVQCLIQTVGLSYMVQALRDFILVMYSPLGTRDTKVIGSQICKEILRFVEPYIQATIEQDLKLRKVVFTGALV